MRRLYEVTRRFDLAGKVFMSRTPRSRSANVWGPSRSRFCLNAEVVSNYSGLHQYETEPGPRRTDLILPPLACCLDLPLVAASRAVMGSLQASLVSLLVRCRLRSRAPTIATASIDSRDHQ